MKILKTLLIIYFFCAIAKAQSPNVLILHLDDDKFMGGDFSACVPNIKGLEKKALCLDNFYSVTATDAVAEILVAKYPATIKNLAIYEDISSSEPSLAKALRWKDYKTAYIGKWRDSKTAKGYPSSLGFDLFFGILDSDNKWPYEMQKKAAKDGKLNNKNIKKPFLNILLNSNIIAIQAKPELFNSTFTAESISFIESSLDAKKPFFLYLNYASAYAPERAVEEFFPTEDKAGIASYYRDLDSKFANILKLLSRREVLDDTIIIFISKSALKATEPKVYNPQNIASEAKHKIPAFVYYPKLFKEPKNLDGLISTLDIRRLVLDCVNDKSGEKSIFGYCLGKNPCDDSPILYYNVHKEVLAIREGDFKVLLDKQNRGIKLQIYNVEKDPLEKNNLIDSMPEEAIALKKKAYLLDSKIDKILTPKEQEIRDKYKKEKQKELEKQKRLDAKALKEAEGLKEAKEKEDKVKEKMLKKQKMGKV